MRRTTSVSCPPISARIDTSAKSREGRDEVPAKITSAMPAPRSDLALFSPIVQRSASSRLDLPQPLGPTIPVRPGAIRRSAGATKLLNPESLRRLICTSAVPPLRCALQRAGRLEHRLQTGPVVHVAGDIAVDDEGRRAAEIILLVGRVLAG